MKRLSDYTRLLQDDSQLVSSLLNEWQPRAFDLSEKAQETDLLHWLQARLPEVPITAQYGIAKGRADIVIQDAHVIELKLGFAADNVGDFDRCVGQMERYKQKWVQQDRGPVYLVIVGNSDTEFRKILHAWFEASNEQCADSLLYAPAKFHLIEKHETVAS